MAKSSPNKIKSFEDDWGSDIRDPQQRPFSGQAVQDFIKSSLRDKAGYFKTDALNENYLVFSDKEAYDKYIANPEENADLLMATIPFASNYNATIELVDTSVLNYVNTGDTTIIKANFAVLNKAGAAVNDDFNVTIDISNGSALTSLSRKVSYGQLFELSINEYLLDGSNIVTISVLSNHYGAGTSISLTYNIINLFVSDSLNISTVYGKDNNVLTVPVNIRGNGLKTVEYYIDNERIEFDSNTDETSQNSTILTKYINISNLEEGKHNLQYRGVLSVNGRLFYSDIVYKDFIVYRGITKNPIIVNAFTCKGPDLIDSTTTPIQLEDIEQFSSSAIQYAIYNPKNLAINALTIAIGSDEETFNVDNGVVYTYNIKPYNIGSTSITFSIENTEVSYVTNVVRTSLSLTTISNTEFEFSGTERNNTSQDKELNNWTFNSISGNTYHATIDGVTYTELSGWTKQGLRLPEGASLEFDIRPLNYNLSINGGTFEFEYETQKVLEDDAIICDLISNGAGISITASEAKILSKNGVELSCRYKSEVRNRVSFVVNPLNSVENPGLIFIYINGILSGVKNYIAGDSFTSSKTLSFTGSGNVQIIINQIRFYKRALNSTEILNNYIVYRPTVDELLSVYQKNDILDDNNNLSMSKLLGQTPIIVITGNIEELQNFNKEDKGTYRKMSKIEVFNLEDPSRNMTLINPSMRCQGTSSMNYPKKNFRFYAQADSKDTTVQNYVTQMFDASGNELTGKERLYSFKQGAQPVKTWCLKADYAESSSTHNTGIARLWNDVMKNMTINSAELDPRYYRQTSNPCRTMAQQAAVDNNYEYDVRTTVDGFPIVLFYHLQESDPLIFLGKYNWNNDKSTESVYGFRDIPGFDNSHMECWEIINGDFPENLFTDISNWNANLSYEGKTMKGWQRGFESRYPDDSGEATEIERAKGALYNFAVWISSLKNASKVQNGKVVVNNQQQMNAFSSQKWNHLDVYKIAAYYIYLMRFGAVDQTVKNAMMTTEDGQHWYYINYDNDTINALDNNGTLSFGYTIDRQTIDERSGVSYCYAGHDSVLWNNLEADADFMRIVTVVDQSLYNAGLRYSNVINIFNNLQSGKWSERLHNIDSQYKYLDPWLNDNNSVGLSKLQGSRDTHRQWWLSNRFAVYDAINITGAYKSNKFQLRVDTVTLDHPVNVYITPGKENQIFGYSKGGTPIVSGEKGTIGVPIPMAVSDQLYIGASLDFYNAVFAKKIDVSALSNYITEVHFEDLNSESFDSLLEELVLGTASSSSNGSLSTLTNLNKAKYLKSLSVCKFNNITNLDLSQNIYLEDFNSTGCQRLSNILFAEGAPLKHLTFSSSLQNLSLDSVNTIETLDIAEDGRSLNNIHLHNCLIDGFTNNPSKLYAWKDARNGSEEYANIYVDNINWNNIDVEELIEFIEYVKSIGDITLRGTCRLENIELEQLTLLRDYFGNNCFETTAALRFIATGVFFVGPSEVLSGGEYQYTIIDAAGAEGTTTFLVTNNASISGINITNEGLLTIPEITNSNKTITISVVFISNDGESIVSKTKDITVLKRVFPENSKTNIIGNQKVVNNSVYTWETSTVGFNADITVEWSLDSDTDNDITTVVRIKEQNNRQCVLEIYEEPSLENGTLKAVFKKRSGTILFNKTINISVFNNTICTTSVINPSFISKLYNAGLCSSDKVLTKAEAALITNEDLKNINNVNDLNLNCIEYFISLNEFNGSIIDVNYKYNSKLKIIFPPSVSSVKNLNIRNAIFKANPIDISNVYFYTDDNSPYISSIDFFVENSIYITSDVTFKSLNSKHWDPITVHIYNNNNTINIKNYALKDAKWDINSTNNVININNIDEQAFLPRKYSGSDYSTIVNIYNVTGTVKTNYDNYNTVFHCFVPSIKIYSYKKNDVNSIKNRTSYNPRYKIYCMNNDVLPTLIDHVSGGYMNDYSRIVVKKDVFDTASDNDKHYIYTPLPTFAPDAEILDIVIESEIDLNNIPRSVTGLCLYICCIKTCTFADGTTGEFIDDNNYEECHFNNIIDNESDESELDITINYNGFSKIIHITRTDKYVKGASFTSITNQKIRSSSLMSINGVLTASTFTASEGDEIIAYHDSNKQIFYFEIYQGFCDEIVYYVDCGVQNVYFVKKITFLGPFHFSSTMITELEEIICYETAPVMNINTRYVNSEQSTPHNVVVKHPANVDVSSLLYYFNNYNGIDRGWTEEII